MKNFMKLNTTVALSIFVLLQGSCDNNQQKQDEKPVTEAAAPAAKGPVNLSPAVWPEGEWEKYIKIVSTKYPGNPEAIGSNGAITGSYYGLAQRAGLEALKQGGTSVDAALTTALTQVALDAGAVISYFGIMQMVHYDAATGDIVTMNAGWDTVENENDPLSIPGSISMESEDAIFGSGDPSGRTALVGGFMRGIEAAHGRYGKLPFKQLFEPSIYIAEDCFPLTPAIADYLGHREEDLRRLPESIGRFLNERGELIKEGELFCQPDTAATLRAIASGGADYMYKGPLAEKIVKAIQADGGKMTLKDLATYEVIWPEPLKAEHSGYTIYANGLPSYGGVNMIEALHLGEAAGIAEQGHWSENGRSLREASDLTFNLFLSYLPNELVSQLFPGAELTPQARITLQNAEKIWAGMEAGAKLGQYVENEQWKHSDTVVAIDNDGNMTAIVHSINSAVWGKTAIMVDGVTIGDPAVNQKPVVAATLPGGRLPDPIEVGILANSDGVPVLPFASMAVGLHQQTFQSLMNIMDFGMSPKEAVDAPAFLAQRPVGGDVSNGVPPQWIVRVMEGDFPKEVLNESGLPIEEVQADDRRYMQGLWAGIYRDPETGEIRAASHPYSNGQALAY